MFALSYLYKSFSLSLFLNLSHSPRGQQEKMGSNGVVIQTEDLESQGRVLDRALCLFPEKVWKRKRGQGLGDPAAHRPPIPPFPPTGDSPLQPFIASAMGGQAGRGALYERGRGLQFELKEGAEGPP